MKNIPTMKIVVGSGTEFQREVQVYKWMTQGEEDEYMNILAGNKELSLKQGNEVEVSTGMSNVSLSNAYIIKVMCVDLKYEEYDLLPSFIRQELLGKLNEVRAYDKKKFLVLPSGSSSLKVESEQRSEV